VTAALSGQVYRVARDGRRNNKTHKQQVARRFQRQTFCADGVAWRQSAPATAAAAPTWYGGGYRRALANELDGV